MVYDFNVKDTKLRYRRHSFLFQYKPKTTQEVVNGLNDSWAHRYGSIIKIDGEEVKIVTDAFDNPTEFGITSVDFKVSEIEEIEFKSHFAESKIFVVVIAIFIIAFMGVLAFLLKNIKALYMLGFLIYLFYFVLSNTIEFMKINIKNKEAIYIPIRKITGFNVDYKVDAFIKDIKSKNSNIIVNINHYRKFNNRSLIYKIVLGTCVIMYALFFIFGIATIYLK